MDLTMRPLMSVRVDGRFYPLTRVIWIEVLFHPYSLLYLSTHLQIFRSHRNHDRLLLFSINVLYDPVGDEIIPAESFGLSLVCLLTTCVESVDVALCQH